MTVVLQCRDGHTGKYNCIPKMYSDAGLSGGLASNGDEDLPIKILELYLPIYLSIYLSIHLCFTFCVELVFTHNSGYKE